MELFLHFFFYIFNVLILKLFLQIDVLAIVLLQNGLNDRIRQKVGIIDLLK